MKTVDTGSHWSPGGLNGVSSQKRTSQRSGHLSFLKEEEDEKEEGGGGGRGGSSSSEGDVRELRAVHAETIQELEKTRNLLSMEGKISKGYKVKLRPAHLASII